MSDIFQEVDEELRHDKWLQLWKRYQNYVIGLAALIVVATAAVTYWLYYDQQQREAEGLRYALALDDARSGKLADAANALNTLAASAHAGRALVARFEAAALQMRAGDQAAAIAAYDAIAKDGGVDQIYRDLATVLWGLHALDTVDPQVVVDRLAPVTAQDNPWHATALEVTAVAHLKTGDRGTAKGDYQRIADDLTAPRGLRARAAQMVAALGS
ncbi:MAG TPA: tetratricopeptide repeat protein [Stellaceae bacterium]|nr:tetratricopeptide repeat protein [Stellaceae bacterium]